MSCKRDEYQPSRRNFMAHGARRPHPARATPAIDWTVDRVWRSRMYTLG